MELYAIKYGENFKYADYGTLFRGAANPSELVPGFAFLYYLAKLDGKVIMFDTGFRSKTDAEKYGTTLIDVESELRNIVDDIYDIDFIVITHSHFDHIDNLDLFKNPSVIISEAEYNYAINNCPDPIKHKLMTSNVIKVKDEYILGNKLRFTVIGGHTEGSSVIYFEECGKKYVITGDECYMCENILRNIPNNFCSDAEKNERFVRDAHENGLIPLTLHDSAVMLNYEQISDHITRIV